MTKQAYDKIAIGLREALEVARGECLDTLAAEAQADGAYDPPGCEALRAFINRQAVEIERLRRDCGEAYQAVGVLAHLLGYWRPAASEELETPITKLLDNLWAAANGDPRLHDDLLPFRLAER